MSLPRKALPLPPPQSPDQELVELELGSRMMRTRKRTENQTQMKTMMKRSGCCCCCCSTTPSLPNSMRMTRKKTRFLNYCHGRFLRVRTMTWNGRRNKVPDQVLLHNLTPYQMRLPNLIVYIWNVQSEDRSYSRTVRRLMTSLFIIVFHFPFCSLRNGRCDTERIRITAGLDTSAFL